MTSETVLVTGSSGFIGFAVARALAETGRDVVGLDPVSPADEIPGVTAIGERLGDVRQMSELLRTRKIDTVVHTGGVSGPMLARDDPYSVCEANVIGTVNLIEAARLHRVRRFVTCSSAAAFGNTPPAPVPDDAPLRPINVYGATKGAGDLILAAYRAQHDLDGISLRLSSVYGPGRQTDCAIRTMLSNALAGRPTRFDWGIGHRRHYLFVSDAVARGADVANYAEVAEFTRQDKAITGVIVNDARVLRLDAPRIAFVIVVEERDEGPRRVLEDGVSRRADTTVLGVSNDAQMID